MLQAFAKAGRAPPCKGAGRKGKAIPCSSDRGAFLFALSDAAKVQRIRKVILASLLYHATGPITISA
jgi:hypothetical protein